MKIGGLLDDRFSNLFSDSRKGVAGFEGIFWRRLGCAPREIFKTVGALLLQHSTGGIEEGLFGSVCFGVWGCVLYRQIRGFILGPGFLF